jgi:hypothetical protein
VGAGALVLVAIALQWPDGDPARLDPRRVAVAALSNETGDSTLAPLGPMVASWITDGLGSAAGIEVVTSATVVPAQHDQHLAQSGADDPARLRILAAETRAGTLVSGSYYRGARGPVEFHVEITDANSGELLRAIGPITSGVEPQRTAANLGRAVAVTVDSLLLHPATNSEGAHRPAEVSLVRAGGAPPPREPNDHPERQPVPGRARTSPPR